MNDERDLWQHLDALRGLHGLSRELNAARDLTTTLQLVVDTVVSSLGFGVAAINLVRGDVLEVAAVAGPSEVRAALAGQTGPRGAWEDLIASAHPWGSLRFLPNAAARLPAGVPSWMPPGGGPDPEPDPRFDVAPNPGPDAAPNPGSAAVAPAAPLGPATATGLAAGADEELDLWHPEDLLFAPLYSSAGELVGVISVDLPATGRVPGSLQRELLEIFAAQAAVAVDNAKLNAELLRTMSRLEREHRALRTSEESFRQAFEDAPSGMAMIGVHPGQELMLLRVNAALCEMLGYPEQELQRWCLGDLAHPEDRGLLPAGDQTSSVDVRLLRHDGRVVWASLNSSIIVDATGAPDFRLIHVEDIGERRDRELQLAHRAAHDPLTGLINRAELRSRLDDLIGEGVGVVVLFCDLDQFKQVNDRYGHDAGDAVLVEVARRLRHRVRRRDLVARIGGEEFVVVLRDVTAGEAEALGGRLDADVRVPVRYGRALISVAMSVGLACSLSTRNVDELLRRADAAMYRVKAARTQAGA